MPSEGLYLHSAWRQDGQFYSTFPVAFGLYLGTDLVTPGGRILNLDSGGHISFLVGGCAVGDAPRDAEFVLPPVHVTVGERLRFDLGRRAAATYVWLELAAGRPARCVSGLACADGYFESIVGSAIRDCVREDPGDERIRPAYDATLHGEYTAALEVACHALLLVAVSEGLPTFHDRGVPSWPRALAVAIGVLGSLDTVRALPPPGS
jgi:hypothetical protein